MLASLCQSLISGWGTLASRQKSQEAEMACGRTCWQMPEQSDTVNGVFIIHSKTTKHFWTSNSSKDRKKGKIDSPEAVSGCELWEKKDWIGRKGSWDICRVGSWHHTWAFWFGVKGQPLGREGKRSWGIRGDYLYAKGARLKLQPCEFFPSPEALSDGICGLVALSTT